MRDWAAALAAMIMLATAFAAPAFGAPRSERALETAIAAFDALERAADPITAGQEGDRAALTRWPDVSPAFEARRAGELEALKSRLEAMRPQRWTPEAQLNRQLLLRAIDQRLALHPFDLNRSPISNDYAFTSLADYLARTLPLRSVADAEAWIARLEALPAFYEANLANLRRGAAQGFVQPRVVLLRGLEVIRATAPDAAAPEKSVLFAPLETLPESLPAETTAQLRARAAAAIAQKVAPAHQAVIAAVEAEILPKARASLAARDLPDGEAYYTALARHHTTTAMTPDEIHALGLAEVARIRGRMEAVIKAAGFQGSFAEFQAFLRSDPRFYAKTPEELLEKASRMAKRADDAMPGLFATLPRLPYGVRPVPDEIADGYTTGRYWSGSPDQGVAGAYIVNTHKLDQRPLHELPALTLHEGVPGHHHQIALSQERKDLPAFRRNGSYTAFIEGWGLYAEYLGEEIGFYQGPYEMFGRLSYEMWRACRLVADTGLHWKRWSLAEARTCFAENSALSAHNITTELERYVADPGQALAYKIGEIELRRLRGEAEAALGPAFDVRRFHDAVLLDGAMPLDVLRTRVEAWTDAQLPAGK